MPPSTAMEELNPLEIFDAIKNMIDRPDFSAETIALIRAYLNDKEEAIKESNLVSKLDYKCGDCGMEFAHRQSHDRHIKQGRCTMKLETTSQEPVINITNAAGNILTDSTIHNGYILK